MTIPEQKTSYKQLISQIEPLQTSLLQHAIYRQISNLDALQMFMEFHVFAVWDFMTLVKSLQRHLTCIDLPWLPPTDIHSARLINDIVLAEETDEVAPGLYTSHFDLYLKAMREVGANTETIQVFIRLLRQGMPAEQALSDLPIHAHTKSFVLNTLSSSRGSIPEVAAAFLLGRETIIPSMFQRILNQLEPAHGLSCESFRLYLDRHIHLDEESHAPMGQKLLQNVCGTDPRKWQQALKSAQRSLMARHRLWDGAIEAMQKLEGKTAARGTSTQISPHTQTGNSAPSRSPEPLHQPPEQQSPQLVTPLPLGSNNLSNAALVAFRKLDLLSIMFGLVALLCVTGIVVYVNSHQDANEEVLPSQTDSSPNTRSIWVQE